MEIGKEMKVWKEKWERRRCKGDEGGKEMQMEKEMKKIEVEKEMEVEMDKEMKVGKR